MPVPPLSLVMTAYFVTKELFTVLARKSGSVVYATGTEASHDTIHWPDICARYTGFLIFLGSNVQVYSLSLNFLQAIIIVTSIRIEEPRHAFPLEHQPDLFLD